MERVSSGNAELDSILCGGFPRNSINVVMGAPGSGKTILAEQMVFANAGPDCRVLYLSTLSEPLAKLVTYLQNYSFANIDLIGSDVIYHSLSEDLSADPAALYSVVLELVKQHRPRIIVIDSFKALADLLPSPQDWRRVVFELAGLLTAYGTTSFWVGEYTWETGAGPVEFAIADGILNLRREQRGSRDERYLRVAKLRGSNFRDGNHAFWIGADGLRVFPRLVTPPIAPDYTPVFERLQTGIVGLDAMIDMGWLRGTSTLIRGPSGSGKSLLGLHFLRQGAVNGEPTLLVNFQENPVQLRRAMSSLGWDVDELLRPEKIDLFYVSPVELQIDTIVREVFQRLRTRGVRRVVIDAVGDLRKGVEDPRRLDDYLYSMLQHFAVENVTTILAMETNNVVVDCPTVDATVSYMCDNLVSLSAVPGDELERNIQILKSRGSAHDGQRRTLRLTPSGVLVE